MVAAGFACRGGGAPEAFVFTPVPYTVVAFGDPGTPVPVIRRSNGGLISADEVIATVEEDRVDAFTAWATSIGFSIERTLPTPPGTCAILLIKVPVGSIDDAIPFIRKQKGVCDVGPSAYLRTLSTSP